MSGAVAGSPADAAHAVLRVAIAVPTFRRPEQLATGLPLLLQQAREVTAAGGYAAYLLVVDNDPHGSAAGVVGTLRAAGPDGAAVGTVAVGGTRSGTPSDAPPEAPSGAPSGAPPGPRVEVRCVAEPVPGISAARNRALVESSDADLLAFIDDDELPAPGWLAGLLAAQRDTGAAAVAAGVVSEFDGPLDPWIAAGGFFARRHRIGVPTGTPVPVAATNNLLLDLRVVRRLGLAFDADFGLSGGEDSLFTSTLTRRGGRIVWCADAPVTERVPADRLTRGWVLRRSVSSGNSEARVAIRLADRGPGRTLTKLRYAAGGGLRALAGLLRALLGSLLRSPRHSARGARAAARGLGMAGGAVNWRYEEYRRDAHETIP